MKIQISIKLVEYKNVDGHKEVKKLMLLATKGIIEKHAGRVRGLGSNIWADFSLACADTTVLELEDEEEKKIEG